MTERQAMTVSDVAALAAAARAWAKEGRVTAFTMYQAIIDALIEREG